MIKDRGEIRGLITPMAVFRGEVQKTNKVGYVAIISKTKAEWNAEPQYMTVKDMIYVYTDYRQEEDPTTHEIKNIPAVKIGDGTSYLIDMPFATIPITEEDIERWNNKSTLNVAVDEETNQMIFTT